MTRRQDRWLLPEGVEEVLPPRAWALEDLRRRLLDLYRGWGYDLILPPLIEYLDSLLTGTGHELDLQTFKLTDQLSGRLLGLRADITPQAARVDANRLNAEGPVRLCYIGAVLRARPDGPGGSRSPMQAGVELFGHGATEADAEVLALMLETLTAAGIEHVHLDLSHVGVYRGVTRRAALDPVAEAELFDILQRKAPPELGAFLAAQSLPDVVARALERLPLLNGGVEVIAEARESLADVSADVHAALDELEAMVARIRALYPDLPLHLDLAELRGYRYHTGLLFAAFVPGHGRELARGGRYDDVGAAFGRARSATGFSTDLHELVQLGRRPDAPRGAVLAPAQADPALEAEIRRLRAAGERVIRLLPEQKADSPKHMGCDRQLVSRKGGWVVENVES